MKVGVVAAICELPGEKVGESFNVNYDFGAVSDPGWWQVPRCRRPDESIRLGSAPRTPSVQRSQSGPSPYPTTAWIVPASSWNGYVGQRGVATSIALPVATDGDYGRGCGGGLRFGSATDAAIAAFNSSSSWSPTPTRLRGRSSPLLFRFSSMISEPAIPVSSVVN